MIFTDYIYTENITDSPDPLGLQDPTSKLIDILVPQFTNNTHNPAYFGLLCTIFLLKKELTNSAENFNRFSRTAEFIWGTTCIKTQKTNGVLNINKFIQIIERYGDKFKLEDIQKNTVLYSRYNYGVVGHYKQPAKKWGLLNANEELTDLGEKLAKAWSRKDPKNNFYSLIKNIFYNHNIHSKGWSKYAAYALEQTPSCNEQKCWQNCIQNIVHPLSKELWKELRNTPCRPNKEIFYQLKNNHQLNPIITAYEWYEKATATIKFLFDYEYLRKSTVKTENLSKLAAASVEFLAMLKQDKNQAETYLKKIPDALQVNTASYTRLIDELVEIHGAHQQRKKRTPYFDKNHNINLKKNCDTIKNILNSSIREPAELTDHYPVNFFFDKVIKWNNYVK